MRDRTICGRQTAKTMISLVELFMKPDEAGDGGLHKKVAEIIKELCEKAYKLRLLMRYTRDHYSFDMPKAGDTFDHAVHVDRNLCYNVVAFAFTPAFWMKDGKFNEWKNLGKAHVWCHPGPEHEVQRPVAGVLEYFERNAPPKLPEKSGADDSTDSTTESSPETDSEVMESTD